MGNFWLQVEPNAWRVEDLSMHHGAVLRYNSATIPHSCIASGPTIRTHRHRGGEPMVQFFRGEDHRVAIVPEDSPFDLSAFLESLHEHSKKTVCCMF
jgi:hypothetical protein